MSYNYEGRSFITDIPTITGDDIKLDWTDTGKFFTPLQDSSRTIDAVTSWLPTSEENRLDIEVEADMLKDTGIKSTGDRTRKEVNNILRWRKKDEQQAFDMSRSSAPGFAMTAQFASTVLNPVEVAVGTAAAFVPGLGPAYLAAKVASKGTKVSRMFEAAKVGAIQNTAIGIGFEPLNYAVETHYGYDYGLTDSLVNVAANTVFGGLFGSGVQRFSDRKGFARTHEQRIWDELPQTSKTEITSAVKTAMDNNIPLKTADIIKIARTDRFFRYASKEGEGEGGFYDKVRAGFLEKIFEGSPDLQARYHELNLQRITKGELQPLRLDYKSIPVVEPQTKKRKAQAVKEAKQFIKVMALKEALDKAKLARKQARSKAELDVKLTEARRTTPSTPEIIKARRIFNDELDKLDTKSKEIVSATQVDKPLSRRHKKILNEVMKAEHSKDNAKMTADLKTMVSRDPLQADPKHETPDTPVDNFDTTPENFEKLLEDTRGKGVDKVDIGVKLRTEKLNNDLKEIDTENAWLDNYNIGECGEWLKKLT